MSDVPGALVDSALPWAQVDTASALVWANRSMQDVLEHVLGRVPGVGDVLQDLPELTRLLDRHNVRWHPPSSARVFDSRWISVEDGWIVELRECTAELTAAAELEATATLLAKAKRAQSDFLGHMSHELRTPLNALVGLSEIALEQHPDSGAVRGMHAQARTLLHRIGALLDFSKLEAGLLSIEPRVCDLAQIVTDVVAVHRPAAAERGVTLEVEVDSSLPRRVRTDPERVRQIAMNLVSNAIRYTPQGSVRVRLKAVAVVGERPMFELAVEDTGIGIPKRDQQLVFTRFFQSYRTADGNKSAGLGLAMTKAIVELMGGAIRLRSAPGEGSIFRVRLPMETVDVVPRGSLTGRTLVRPAHILTADDSPHNLVVLTRLLQANGDQVMTAADGQEALDVFASRPMDLIVMDVDMAPMDGLRATIEIRARESLLGLPRTPIVALTAHAMPEVRERCLASGMDEFLVKPVDSTLLAEAVERWVDRRARVLVVDDAPTSQAVLSAALTSVGARVSVASTAEEGLAAFAGFSADVALLDHDLPDQSGPELAERLRARGFEGVIFAITGHGDAHRDAWARVQVVEVFSKPVDLERMLDAIRTSLTPPANAGRSIDPDIADLVPGYLEDRRADVVRLRAALASGERELVRRVGHQIRGSGTSYGYPDLTALGEQLELQAAAGSTANLSALVDQMHGILSE